MSQVILSTDVVREDITNIANVVNSSLNILDNTTIAITGANGFLASNFIYYILNLSCSLDLNIRVHAYCRSSSSLISRFSAHDYERFFSHLHIFPYDSTSNFSDSPPADYIIHAASNASPDLFAKDPFGTCSANTIGTIQSLNYAIRSNCRNYILLSTSGVYGSVGQSLYPLSENSYGAIDPTDKKNIYLLSKKNAECLVVNASTLHSLNFNIIRPSIIYGPGLSLSDVRSMPYFLNCFLNDTDIYLNSSGRAYRNYLYISDFIVALIRLLVQSHNLPFNVASSVDTMIYDLAVMFSQLSTSDIQVYVASTADAVDRVEFMRTSTKQQRIEELTGWKETVPLNSGISNLIRHYSSLISANP